MNRVSIPDSIFVYEPETASGQGWFAALLEAVSLHPKAQMLAEAGLVIPGIDPLNAHYPRYAYLLKHRGGPDAFFRERERRMEAIWMGLEQLLPSLAAWQQVLLFDLESSHVPSSAMCHRRKRMLPGDVASRLVHVCIASSRANYRPGVDVSFPGVIPESLGDASHAHIISERRPILFSFKGVNSHPVRIPLYALHNGDDQICIDAVSLVPTDQSLTPSRQVVPPSDERGANRGGRPRSASPSSCGESSDPSTASILTSPRGEHHEQKKPRASRKQRRSAAASTHMPASAAALSLCCALPATTCTRSALLRLSPVGPYQSSLGQVPYPSTPPVHATSLHLLQTFGPTSSPPHRDLPGWAWPWVLRLCHPPATSVWRLSQDGWVLPFSEMDDVVYERFAVLLPEAHATRTADALRAISIDQRAAMQREGARVFATYFCSVRVQFAAVVEIIKARQRLCGAAPWRYTTPDQGTVGGGQTATPSGWPQLELCTEQDRTLPSSYMASRCGGPGSATGTMLATAGGCRSSFRVRAHKRIAHGLTTGSAGSSGW